MILGEKDYRTYYLSKKAWQVSKVDKDYFDKLAYNSLKK